MSNVIRVDIIPEIPVRIKDLYQWDTGQVLEIHGSNLSGTIEGRFSVNGMEPTLDQQGTITGGVAKIAIPDSVLKKSGKLKVYIRKTDKSSATTEYVAVGMIRKTEKPSGNAESALSLQNKTVTPSKKIQSVTADSGYDALGKVTVNAIPSDYIQPSGEKGITTNGTFDVKSYASANVNVPSSGADTSDATATASNIESGYSAYTAAGKTDGTLEKKTSVTVAGGNAGYGSGNGVIEPFVNIKAKLGGTKNAIITPNTQLQLQATASQFGDATESDVRAGKTFTSKDGIKLTGTDSGAATASGSVTLSADASEIVVDTGLAAVNGFILYKEADSDKNSTHGWIKTDIASFLMYFTYSTHFPTKGYDTEVDSLIAVSGGTVTCKQRSSSYPILSGTYNWIAW